MEALLNIEHDILFWIQQNLRGGVLDTPLKLITKLGDVGAFWIGLSLVLMFFRRTRRTGMFCGASILLAFLLVNCAIKPLIGRVRPYTLFSDITSMVGAESDKSFPSGHASNSFACAWMLCRVGKRRALDYAALALAILISLSRLFVGVHYPTDVLCGILIGIICSEIAMRIMKKYWKRIKPFVLPKKKVRHTRVT